MSAGDRIRKSTDLKRRSAIKAAPAIAASAGIESALGWNIPSFTEGATNRDRQQELHFLGRGQ